MDMQSARPYLKRSGRLAPEPAISDKDNNLNNRTSISHFGCAGECAYHESLLR